MINLTMRSVMVEKKFFLSEDAVPLHFSKNLTKNIKWSLIGKTLIIESKTVTVWKGP